MKGMMMKQNAIDENRAKLQQMRDEIAGFSVARDVDKKYLEERLQQTTDIVNQYASMDLSNKNLTNQLVSKFEEIVDDTVLNAVASTSTRRQEEQEWKSKMGTDEYNEINYIHQSKNWQKYLENGSLNATYNGGGGFVKYKDLDAMYVSKEFQDFLKNSNIKAEYIRREDGTGYFASINKYEGIDDVRLRQAIESYGGEDAKRQLQINAWAKYGDPTSEEAVNKVRQDYENLINKDLEYSEKNLDAIDKILEGNKLSPEQRAQYEAQKDMLEKRVTSLQAADFNAKISNTDGTLNEQSFKNIYTSMYEQQFFDEKFNLLYHDPIFKDSQIDEVQYKTATYLESKRMNDLAVSEAQRKAQMDMWEMQGKPMLNPDGSYAEDEFGNKIYLSKQGSSKESGKPGAQGQIYAGEMKEVSKEEADDISLTKDYKERYQNTVNNIRKNQNNNWDENSTIALENYLMANVPSPGSKIKLSTGREIMVTSENIEDLENLKAMVDGDTGTIRKLRVELRDYQKKYNSALDQHYFKPNGIADIITVGQDMGDFVFVDDGNGNMIYKEGKKIPNKQGLNNFAYLMAKKASNQPLTKEEQYSLSLYKTKALLRDKDLSSLEKQQLYRAYKADLGMKTANSMPNFNQVTKSYTTEQRNMRLSKIDPQTIGGGFQMVKEGLQELGSNSVGFKTIDVEKGNDFKAYTANKEKILKQAREVLHRNKIVIPKDHPNRDELRMKVGLPADYKGDIRLVRVIKDAKPQDEFTVEYDAPKKVKEGGVTQTTTEVKETGQKIKLADLNQMNFGIDFGTFTPFNASLGREAQKLGIVGGALLYNQNNVWKGQTSPQQIFSDAAKTLLKEEELRMRVELDQPNFDIFKALEGKSYLKPELEFRAENGRYYLFDKEGNVVTPKKKGRNINGMYVELKSGMVKELKMNSDAYALDYIIQKVREEYNLN